MTPERDPFQPLSAKITVTKTYSVGGRSNPRPVPDGRSQIHRNPRHNARAAETSRNGGDEMTRWPRTLKEAAARTNRKLEGFERATETLCLGIGGIWEEGTVTYEVDALMDDVRARIAGIRGAMDEAILTEKYGVEVN